MSILFIMTDISILQRHGQLQQLFCCLTYIVIDFGWRLNICWLVFEYQSWEYSCDFVLSVQLEKRNLEKIEVVSSNMVETREQEAQRTHGLGLKKKHCYDTWHDIWICYRKSNTIIYYTVIHEKKKVAVTYPDIHDLGDFPQVNKEANEDADLHHKVCLIVEYVQQHHQRLKHTKNDGAHREAFQRLPAVPKLDICGGKVGEV